MIVALLVLIVFILMFGAGVVKGFLANALAIGGGAIVFLGLLLWVGSFFGGNGFEYAIYVAMALLVVLSLWVKSAEPQKSDPVGDGRDKRIVAINKHTRSLSSATRFHSNAPPKDEQKRLMKALRDMEKHPPS